MIAPEAARGKSPTWRFFRRQADEFPSNFNAISAITLSLSET
jgi:hypothetical protein